MKNIFFTEDGDFHIENNEVYIATSIKEEAYKNAILQRIQSKADDWKLDPNGLASFYGIDISEYMGSKITNNLISAIKYFLTIILTEDSLVKESNLVIFDLPIDYNTLILKMSIQKNNISNEVILIDISYDLRSNRLIPKIVNAPEGEIWQN